MENSRRASILEVIFKVLESERVPSSFAFPSFEQDFAASSFANRMFYCKCAQHFERLGIPEHEWMPLATEQITLRFQRGLWITSGMGMHSPLIKPRRAPRAEPSQLDAIAKAWSGIVLIKHMFPTQMTADGKAILGGVVRTGSGFFVDFNLIVTDITAVQSVNPIVQVSSGHRVRSTVLSTNPSCSLALLQLDSVPINQFDLRLSTDCPKFKEHLIEAGFGEEFPGDGVDAPVYTHVMFWEKVQASVVRMFLANREDGRRMVYAAAASRPNSLVGSPVFDESGRVIGMHSRSAEQASFITPAADIADFVAITQQQLRSIGELPPHSERPN